MVANIVPADSQGQKVNIQLFQYNVMYVAYPIKGNQECSNIVANILPAHPTLVIGSIGQKSTFSEHGHVAYHFKGKQEMQQHGHNMV